MIYITGDMHGNIEQLHRVMNKINIKEDNTLIVLGDFGGNYYCNKKDNPFKNAVQEYNINLFVIRGNHDANPDIVCHPEYRYDNFGEVDDNFNNIFYARNSCIYNIQGFKFLVLGGAYSVDKWYRLEHGYRWFTDEQMTLEEQQIFLQNAPDKVQNILSHTCPYPNIPKHLFLPQVDQNTVDTSMELFLSEVKCKVKYDNWFFGHYHANEQIEKNMYMLYDGVIKYKPIGKLKIY